MRKSTSWLTLVNNLAVKEKNLTFFAVLINFFVTKKHTQPIGQITLTKLFVQRLSPIKAITIHRLVGGYMLTFLAILFSLITSSRVDAQNAPLNCDKYYMLVGELVNNSSSRTDVYQYVGGVDNSPITSCKLPDGGGEGMVVDPTKNIAYIATSSGVGQIRVYDIIAGAFLTPIQFPAGEDLLDVSASSDFAFLYVSTYTGLYKVSTTTKTIVASKLKNTFVNSTTSDLWGSAVHPTTGNVYVSTNWQFGNGTSTIEYVSSSLGTATRLVTAPSGFQYRGIVFDNDGTLWAVMANNLGQADRVVQYNSTTGAVLKTYTFPVPSPNAGITVGNVNPFDLAFGPNDASGNRILYITTFSGDCVTRLNTSLTGSGAFSSYLDYVPGISGKSITFVCGNFKCICNAPVINDSNLAISGGNCNGGTANNNGSVTISNLSSSIGTVKADINQGSSYGTSPIYGAGSNLTLASGATSLTFKT